MWYRFVYPTKKTKKHFVVCANPIITYILQTKPKTRQNAKIFIACAYDKPNDPRPYILSVCTCLCVPVFDDDHTKHSRKPEKKCYSRIQKKPRENATDCFFCVAA